MGLQEEERGRLSIAKQISGGGKKSEFEDSGVQQGVLQESGTDSNHIDRLPQWTLSENMFYPTSVHSKFTASDAHQNPKSITETVGHATPINCGMSILWNITQQSKGIKH